MKLIKDLGLRPSTTIRDGKVRNFRWGLYECPYCKSSFEYKSGRMKASAPKSCGCLKGESHGDWKTDLYGIWKSMKQRCLLPTAKAYKYYGGRGITICQQWLNSYLNFKTWALTAGYSAELSIDRINVDGNYEPSNCRWVTKTVQSRNTKQLRSTNTSGFRGVSFSTRDQKFRSYITVDKVTTSLGYHDTALGAAKAYDTYVVTHNLEHTINGVLHEPIHTSL